ncbi:alpha 1,2 mannosyltransferase [Coemansia erecta]|nr:alpha 1,2 mannosyltransferase [Coemansia erecta]
MRRSTAVLFYGSLLVLRVLLALTPSYIHPDEFFQAPEISAGDILKLDVQRTWEFTSAKPIRSILPVFVFTGPPLALLRVMRDVFGVSISSAWLFRASRGFAALLSLLVDVNVLGAIRRSSPGVQLQATAVLLASSYCVLVFHTHTFSNAYASVVLSVCFNLLSRIEQCKVRKSTVPVGVCVGFGCLMTFGSFVHISFAMFAMPLGIGAVVMAGIGGAAWMALGGIFAASVAVTADTAYYGGSLSAPVLTMANNFRYNSDADNLATHGRHPRFMHLLVSLPLLFGPLLFLALYGLWAAIKRRQTVSYLSTCAGASVICGLGLLSLAPHQEPRFMVPALSGIFVASWRWHRVAPRHFWILWVVFNLAMALIFGVVHQTGIVPAARYLAETSVFGSPVCKQIAGSPAHAVCMPSTLKAVEDPWVAADNVTTRALFYRSFPAPRHLLNQPLQPEHPMARVKITDLIMISDADAQSILLNQPLVRCSLATEDIDKTSVFLQTELGHFERSLLAVPASADIAQIIRPLGSSVHLIPLFSYRPHVNFDHIAEVLRNPMQRSSFDIFLMCQT